MWMWKVLGTGLALGMVAVPVALGQGPGEQPILRDPFSTSAPPPSGLPYSPAPQTARGATANQPDINQDILVTEKQGPWMIFVHWYTGPEAAVMARKMVMELRGQYRLSAFVFNHGAEERRKEDARVKALIDKQRQFLAEKGLPLNSPMRVKRLHVEEQCAVLVGDFADDAAARRGLADLRRLKPPDPNRVPLSKIYEGEVDEKTGKGRITREQYDNPFNRAFVIHNPLLKAERQQESEQSELAAMKMLTRDEEHSLFKCAKPYTLVVKQFLMPNVTQPRSGSGSGSFLAALGLNKIGDDTDNAALNAHNLADLMRKSFQLEAYVLHTRHSSIVTVGGFDGLADPRLRSTQEMLVNRLKIPSARPMPVPR